MKYFKKVLWKWNTLYKKKQIDTNDPDLNDSDELGFSRD